MHCWYCCDSVAVRQHGDDAAKPDSCTPDRLCIRMYRLCAEGLKVARMTSRVVLPLLHRSPEKLSQAAARLQIVHPGVAMRTIVQDMTTAGAADAVCKQLDDVPVRACVLSSWIAVLGFNVRP